MDDDALLSPTAALHDESGSGNISVRLSAIHALMTISEPMGYNDIYVPLPDEKNRIAGHEMSQIDDHSNYHPTFDRRNHQGLISKSTVIPNAVAAAECHGNSNSRASLGYQHADSIDQNQCLEDKNQSYDFYRMRATRGSLSTFIPTESHTGLRKCRFEGCIEKISLVSQAASSDFKDGDDRVYHHSLYCKKHLLGSRKCEYKGCDKCAQGSTKFCIKHGGGRRCTVEGCNKGARDKNFCAGHGGGKRCSVEHCSKSAVGGSGHCCVHGGGKKCIYEGCNKSAQSPTQFCVKHGGGKTCSVLGCIKVSRGTTLYCAGHGGGTRCKIEDCKKAAMSSNDVCRIHAEYSSMLIKPKKGSSEKSMLEIGGAHDEGKVAEIIPGRGRERGSDNIEYDAIHDGRYFISHSGVFDIGTESGIYFNNDSYNPHIEDNNITCSSKNDFLDNSRGVANNDNYNHDNSNKKIPNSTIDPIDQYSINDGNNNNCSSNIADIARKGNMKINLVPGIRDPDIATNKSNHITEDKNRSEEEYYNETLKDENSMNSLFDMNDLPEPLSLKKTKRNPVISTESKVKRRRKSPNEHLPTRIVSEGLLKIKQERCGSTSSMSSKEFDIEGSGRDHKDVLIHSLGYNTSVTDVSDTFEHPSIQQQQQQQHQEQQQQYRQAHLKDAEDHTFSNTCRQGQESEVDYSHGYDLNYFNTAGACDIINSYDEVQMNNRHANGPNSRMNYKDNCGRRNITSAHRQQIRGGVERNSLSLEHGIGHATGLPLSSSFDDVLQALDRIGQPQYFRASSDPNMMKQMSGGNISSNYVSYQSLKNQVFNNVGPGLGSSSLGRLGIDILGHGIGFGMSGDVASRGRCSSTDNNLHLQRSRDASGNMNIGPQHSQHQTSIPTFSHNSTSTSLPSPSSHSFSYVSSPQRNRNITVPSSFSPSSFTSSNQISTLSPSSSSSSSILRSNLSMNSSSRFSDTRDNNLVSLNYTRNDNNNINNSYDYNNFDSNNINNDNNNDNNNNNMNNNNNNMNNNNDNNNININNNIVNNYERYGNYNYINNLLPVITVDSNATTALKSYSVPSFKQEEFITTFNPDINSMSRRSPSVPLHSLPPSLPSSLPPSLYQSLPPFYHHSQPSPLPFYGPASGFLNTSLLDISNSKINLSNNSASSDNENHLINGDNNYNNFYDDNNNISNIDKEKNNSIYNENNNFMITQKLKSPLVSVSANNPYQYTSTQTGSQSLQSISVHDSGNSGRILRNLAPKNHVTQSCHSDEEYTEMMSRTADNYHFNSVQALLSILPQCQNKSEGSDDFENIGSIIENNAFTEVKNVFSVLDTNILSNNSKSRYMKEGNLNSSSSQHEIIDKNETMNRERKTRIIGKGNERGSEIGRESMCTQSQDINESVSTELSLRRSNDEIDIMDSSFAADILLTYAAQVYDTNMGGDDSAEVTPLSFVLPQHDLNSGFDYQFDVLLGDDKMSYMGNQDGEKDENQTVLLATETSLYMKGETPIYTDDCCPKVFEMCIEKVANLYDMESLVIRKEEE